MGTDQKTETFSTMLPQVRDQYIVVAHLADALKQLADDNVRLLAVAGPTSLGLGILELKGRETARIMETLGDILNGMDAVEPADSWVDAIFQVAQKMFPANAAPAGTKGGNDS